jgi:hypothetical protein
MQYFIKVKESVDSIQQSLMSLKQGNLTDAFYSSKTAFVSSEKAFFDKSLLEKLYFPEDQRYVKFIQINKNSKFVYRSNIT